MFKVIGTVNRSEIPIIYYAFHKLSYLHTEPCQIGKNINIKFKDELEKKNYLKKN